MTVEAGAQSNGASGSASSGTTGSTTTAGGSAPSAATGSTPPTGGAQAAPDGSAGTTPPAPAYTPNFKFKFTSAEGKETEQEIHDLFKPLVKSENEEKRLREMHEKAMGLDFIKSDREKLKQNFTQVSGELNELKAGIGQLRQYVQQRDFDSFFQELAIPQQMIMEYALQKAQYAKLTPEQRAAYDAQTNERRQYQQLQQQNQLLQQQHQQAAVALRQNELFATLSKPDIAAMVSAFDAKVGRPGSFAAEVVRRGQHAALTTGQDVPVEAIVAEMMGLYGNFVAATAPAGNAAPAIVQPQTNAPTLPNIGGKGTSPAKQVPKSIADLHARRAALEAAGG